VFYGYVVTSDGPEKGKIVYDAQPIMVTMK
jgi:hypothetical protein